MPTTTILSIGCANCHAEFDAKVQTIIDGRDLSLKAALLQDELNVLECPQCNTAIQPLTPTYYYDVEKKLALAFIPAELAFGALEQKQAIDELANTVVNSLPKKQRKPYLFAPQVLASQEEVANAILTADGITPAMVVAQTAKVQLIEEFLQLQNEHTFQAKVSACASDLDMTFFELLTARIQAAQLQGDDARAQTFLQLRGRLGRSDRQRQAMIQEIDTKLGLTLLYDRGDLLEKLQQAPDKQARKPLVAAGFDLLDDDFFKLLTAKFEQAAKARNKVTENALRQTRNDVLELKADHAKASQAVLANAEALFTEVVQSSTPDQVLKEKLDQVNETFFFVLGTNIAKAQQKGETGPAQALIMLGHAATDLLQKRQVASGG